jgi:hypothetical protein
MGEKRYVIQEKGITLVRNCSLSNAMFLLAVSWHELVCLLEGKRRFRSSIKVQR